MICALGVKHNKPIPVDIVLRRKCSILLQLDTVDKFLATRMGTLRLKIKKQESQKNAFDLLTHS